MPTYQNNRQANLSIEACHNANDANVHHREIAAGAVFVAHSSAIPARWLTPNPVEGGNAVAWVTKLFNEPDDEELEATPV